MILGIVLMTLYNYSMPSNYIILTRVRIQHRHSHSKIEDTISVLFIQSHFADLVVERSRQSPE